jgi:hypothetical protein
VAVTAARTPRRRAEAVPLPPPDPTLPGPATALDGEAVAALLGERLGDAMVLRSCRPSYIRYKPGTSCIVAYRLRLEEDGGGGLVEVPAHLKLYGGDRAARRWAKGALHALAARATAWCPQPPIARVAHVPELAAILSVYPVDPGLPGLAFAASDPGRRDVLRRVGRPVHGTAGGVDLVRSKPRRKALLRYPSDDGSLWAKLYVDDRAPLVERAGRALAAAGIATPRPLAHLPELRMLVHAEARGTRLRDLRGGPAFAAGAEAAGAAVARMHTMSLCGHPVHPWAEEAGRLAAAARAIAAVRPDLAADAAALVGRMVDGLADLEPVAAASHGDLYDDQVLVGPGGVVLLDLDAARNAHPLLDVGNFLAQQSVWDEDEPARGAFLEGYGPARPDLVALCEAAAVLKLAIAPFRRLEGDWPEGVEARVRIAARRLEESGRGGPPPARRPLDPALPQLPALTRPALVADVLAREVYRAPVTVTAAEIVRHKRGRRCALRYDLLIGAGAARRGERLYGKSFASDRGPRVHRALQAIAAVRPGGPAVAFPEPVAYLDPLKLLLQRDVGGVPAREGLVAGDVTLAARIAEAVHALHRSEVLLERTHGLADELGILRARVEGLAVAHRARARRCFAGLEGALAAGRFRWRTRPIHRDLYHDQIRVRDDGLALLDLDDAAMSEPAVDVANLVAHLRLLCMQEPAHADPVRTAAAAFATRARTLDPELDPALLALLERATLLRLACIHERLTEPLIAAAEEETP